MNRTTVDLVGRLAQRIDLNSDTALDSETAHKADPVTAFPDAFGGDFSGRQKPNPDILENTPGPPEKAQPAELITLDLQSLRDKGFLTPLNHNSLLAEEYRIIKRPMLRSAFNTQRSHDDREHIALVTSPHANDGKTFTTINLGMSIASEHDLHVLLIDGDVRQRGLSHAFGVSERKGLMDALSDPGLSLADVILRTNVPDLSIIPAGHSVDAPTEILASPRMQTLMGDITRRYPDRFIIIDSPPVLATSEPGVLASYVGQVVMVVRANETTRQAIAESLALVDACSNVNFILNSVTLSAGSDRFGY